MAEIKIPLSTTYRRIQSRHDNKLVATSGMITDEGKRLFLYKSKIKEIQSSFSDSMTEVELIINNCSFSGNHFTMVTGAFALCKTKFDVLPKNNSFGNPIPLDPMII